MEHVHGFSGGAASHHHRHHHRHRPKSVPSLCDETKVHGVSVGCPSVKASIRGFFNSSRSPEENQAQATASSRLSKDHQATAETNVYIHTNKRQYHIIIYIYK